MSFRALTAVLDHERTTKGTERTILMVLAEAAGDDGLCFLKVKTIAGKANVSTRAAQDALAKLVEKGLVERELNAWPGTTEKIPKHLRPNLWKVCVSDLGLPVGGAADRIPPVRATAPHPMRATAPRTPIEEPPVEPLPPVAPIESSNGAAPKATKRRRIDYPDAFEQIWQSLSTLARNRAQKPRALEEFDLLVGKGFTEDELVRFTIGSYNDTPERFHRGLERQLRDHIEPLILKHRAAMEAPQPDPNEPTWADIDPTIGRV